SLRTGPPEWRAVVFVPAPKPGSGKLLHRDFRQRSTGRAYRQVGVDPRFRNKPDQTPPAGPHGRRRAWRWRFPRRAETGCQAGPDLWAAFVTRTQLPDTAQPATTASALRDRGQPLATAS